MPRPLLYTGQDLARFCEVDLKTIHHWADGGKIPHHRTAGRHLRFRRNDILAFLRRHGYPVAPELADVRPTVFFAVMPRTEERPEGSVLEDVAKKLAARFFVRRFESALAAIAHLVAGEPDAIVVSAADPTWSCMRGVRALKAHGETAWPTLVVVADDSEQAGEMKHAGAELVIGPSDLGRLSGELARYLGID
jgi:excisionase family DNA binding protein